MVGWLAEVWLEVKKRLYEYEVGSRKPLPWVMRGIRGDVHWDALQISGLLGEILMSRSYFNLEPRLLLFIGCLRDSTKPWPVQQRPRHGTASLQIF